jgi:hypothetical protein
MNDVLWLTAGGKCQWCLCLNSKLLLLNIIRDKKWLTICLAVKVEIERSSPTAGREDVPVCGQHVKIHINLLCRVPNMQAGEPIAFSADVSE